MGWLKRVAEIVIVFVVLPLALLFFGAIVLAVGVGSVLIYSGSLLAAWVFSAIALPMLFGALSPSEIVEGYQSRRRHERLYEGEQLGAQNGSRSWHRLLRRHRLHRRREKFYPLEVSHGPRQGFPFWKAGRFTLD
jgi:hypothetical protein